MWALASQRERERRNSDKSEDGYHSDGDYGEHDYRNDINDEKESKTIMLRGLPITVTENDVSSPERGFTFLAAGSSGAVCRQVCAVGAAAILLKAASWWPLRSMLVVLPF